MGWATPVLGEPDQTARTCTIVQVKVTSPGDGQTDGQVRAVPVGRQDVNGTPLTHGGADFPPLVFVPVFRNPSVLNRLLDIFYGFPAQVTEKHGRPSVVFWPHQVPHYGTTGNGSPFRPHLNPGKPVANDPGIRGGQFASRYRSPFL